MSDRSSARLAFGSVALGVTVLLGGCAAPGDSSEPAPVEPVQTQDESAQLAEMLDPCSKPNLTTVEPGALTFVTSAVPAPPYFLSERPDIRRGLEADLAYALADQLGFRPGEVTWEYVPADQVLSGQFTAFDVAIGGFSKPVSDNPALVFSRPYHEAQLVVVAESSRVRDAVNGTAPDEQEPVDLGSLRWASSAHQVDAGDDVESIGFARETPSFAGAQQLVSGGEVWDVADVVITDQAHTSWVEVIAGQAPLEVSGLDVPSVQYSLALVRGNPLESCIDQALTEMSEAGTLLELNNRWLDPNAWGED